MSVHTSVLHQIYEQRDLARFRAFLTPTGVSGGPASRKGKESAATIAGGTAGSYGASGSLSRSPRFGGAYFGESNHPNGATKDEVNARDRLGRSVLHLVASEIATFPEDAAHDATTSLDYLEALLKSPVININLQDRENGWTALHRAVYAGNLILVRRLLQHPDTNVSLRDCEGLTAFDLLNSTLPGTNPMDPLDNMSEEDQEDCRRELVAWGANRNFVLGLQGDSERTFPERVVLEHAVPTYRKPGEAEDRPVASSFDSIAVEKIAMSKLHSGIITDEPRGNFRMCGFASTTGRLGAIHTHTQFAFEPLKGFENQRVVDFALGQDHTIALTQEGNIYTFGLNAFSVLGYPVENATPVKGGPLDDDLVQITPKRLFGVFKKEFVKGVAASRYHSVAFTEDALYTWGKNNGQLGYSSSATPIQPTPRKVAAVDKPIKQVCATEVATVCLLESGEVLVLHRDTHFRIAFPTTRLPAAMQPYRPPKLSWRSVVTKIDGSGGNFIAITSMGDLFSWQLDNPSLEAPSSAPSNYGRDIKPYRVWEERKVFTACKDAAIAGDTIIIATRSGHVYVSARRKELSSLKGVELRGNGSGQAGRRNHKFTKVPNLQRVTQVAVSSSGGFGAIRRDAPLVPIAPAGDTLADSLLRLLPHYRRIDEVIAKGKALPSLSLVGNAATDNNEIGEEDEDESLEADMLSCARICQIVQEWSPLWSLPLAGSDTLLVAEGAACKIPVHSTILIARSPVLKRILSLAEGVPGITYNTIGTPTLAIPKCQHITLLLLLHYLYSDNLPAIFDGRVFRRVRAQFPAVTFDPTIIKAELAQLAEVLELTSLSQALRGFGKISPTPTLADATLELFHSSIQHDVILGTAEKDIQCHSTVLRATCPFFEAIFGDPDWYAERMDAQSEDGASRPLVVDLAHLASEVVEIAIEDLYTEDALTRLESRKYANPEERLNFAISVLSVANELMLDRLRTVCSTIIRPFINLNTVCALLCEGIFYESPSLQNVCMQYMASNIETVLEQRLLDLLPVHALDRFAAFCRRRQLDRLPRTGRSITALAELQKRYPDFFKELDVPKPTGGYRRYSKNTNNAVRSPKLSPAQFTASLRVSPNPLTSPATAVSPKRVPPSPALSAVSANSTHERRADGDDGETFDMEDLSIEEPVASVSQVLDPLQVKQSSSSRLNAASGLPWRRAAAPSAPATSFQEIMAQETSTPAKAVYTPPRRVSETHPSMRNVDNSPVSPPHKLTQKERKRQQASVQSESTAVSVSSAEKGSSPWRPILPGAWKPPTLEQEKPSLAGIQAQQNHGPGSLPTPRTASGRATPDASHPLSRQGTSAQGSKEGAGATPGRDVNAANAPVITPVRLQPKRDFSNHNRPPETRSHDSPWVNYVSTVPVKPSPDVQSGASHSFATIQDLQGTEKDAIRKARGPMSLMEIQAEEDAVRREAEFLTWFEEESKRAQQAAGIAVKPEKGGGRGRGGRGGGATRGGSAHRGGRGGGTGAGNRGRGQQKPKVDKASAK